MQTTSSLTRPSTEQAMEIIARSAAATQTARATATTPTVGCDVQKVFASIVPAPPVPSKDYEAERRQQEQAERATRRLDVAQRLWEASCIPPRFLDADLDDVGDDAPGEQAKVIDRLRRLLDEPSMLGLIGNRGSGKTWMCAATVREFCRNGRRARYTRAMDVFRAIRATFGK